MMNRLTLFAVSMVWLSAGCASQYETARNRADRLSDRFAAVSRSYPDECVEARAVDCRPSEYGQDSYHCSKFDEKALESKLRECAAQALFVIEEVTHQEFSDDFEDGFEQAFVDLSQNRKGVTPAVPPPRYWHAYYRAPHGRRHVYDWYAGYELGTQEAFRAGIHTWTEVVSLAALYGMSGPDCMPAHHVQFIAPPAASAPAATAPHVFAMPQAVRAPQPIAEPQAYAVLQRAATPQPLAAPTAFAVPRPVSALPAVAPRPPVARPTPVAAAPLPAQPIVDYRFTASSASSNPSVSYRLDASAIPQSAGNPEMDYRTNASHSTIESVEAVEPTPVPRPVSSPSVRGY
jgi:hypothetical protein